MPTDTEIRKAAPGDKPVRLFDGGGLYLEVSRTGGKWWRLRSGGTACRRQDLAGCHSSAALHAYTRD
jgi:hypothetical protein